MFYIKSQKEQMTLDQFHVKQIVRDQGSACVEKESTAKIH